MRNLHTLMDEKVDVYAENERFQDLLNKYNNERDNKYIEEMWPIMYRCASNILKRRFGKHWSWEKISDTAIEMVSLIIRRIKNKEKYPNGYEVHNLPTQMKFAILNVVYGPKARLQELEDANISLDELDNRKY